MKRKPKPICKLTALFLVPILLGSLLTGCKKNPTPIPDGEPQQTDSTQADTTDPSENNTADVPEKNDESEKDSPEPDVPLYVDPLTGLKIENDYTHSRPVAVMINNIHQAIPQYGISHADILYECIVEGGITRLMAVFPDVSAIPYLGSVRSARDYYIDLAQAHDALYAHCGGSPDAYLAVSSRKIQNLDGVNGAKAASDAFWKDADRVRNMGYEHASMTNGEKLVQAIESLGYRNEISDGFSQPLQFTEDDVVRDGEKVLSCNIAYSFYAQSFFSYDPARTCFVKGQYNAEHIDAGTGFPLTYKNVLILSAIYSNIAGDEKNRLDLNFTGTGKGYYLTNGVKTDIVWKKSDRQSPYSLYEADGETPLLLNPGKTYVGITNGLSCVSFSDETDPRLDKTNDQ